MNVINVLYDYVRAVARESTEVPIERFKQELTAFLACKSKLSVYPFLKHLTADYAFDVICDCNMVSRKKESVTINKPYDKFKPAE
jgi:hypothetical protein